MSTGSNDPRMLYSINDIRAYHLQNGDESDLTPSGPQTLSLLMVPTSSSTQTSTEPPSGTPPEEDFYLHLHLPPELDLPLPATTQIYHQPPTSYLIPRWDLGPDAGAFTRIEFPAIGSGPGKITQEDIDTFETILAQCTAFLERAGPPQGQGAYNPADFAPGEGYVGTGGEKPTGKKEQQHHGQIVMVDEENGSVVGELTQGYNVVETDVKPGSKIPVEIQLPAEGNQINISSATEDYLQITKHPAYQKSTIVQTSATASRLIVTGSSYVSSALQSGADSFTKKTKPNPEPMTFAPTTQERIRKINSFSTSAAGLSAKTVGQVGKYAQNFGASLVGRGEKGKKGYDKNGQPIPDYKPGVLNKSMIAFSTVADGIEHGARNLLYSGSTAASTVVGHRYGPEAGAVASDLAGGAKNVGLVYIDAAGVSRKAVIKSVAKGMVVGQMRDGKQVVVGTGDGGQLPSNMASPSPTPPEKAGGLGQSSSSHSLSGMSSPYHRGASPAPTPPPAYGAQTGRTLGGMPSQTEKY